ncbi:MAG: MBL fold metallo-hydrolase [Gemmatimonadetes bacterium]|nr:MBL fold metallo-hydrolase [Gemmatimonadota bacterium]
MSVDALRDLLERREPVTVLDVRPTAQRQEWSIPESRHVDAYQALWAGDADALSRVDLPTDRPVVTVCAVGNTSLLAADHLRRRGLKALSLHGGMRAWSLAWNAADVAVPGTQAGVVQVRRTGKGCLSYLIGSAGEAAVIDPSVDVAVYRQLAQSHGWRITKVVETHIHADHLSRARELMRQSGAELYLPEQPRVRFPFQAVKEGDALKVGSSYLEALRTPGHTFESTCYLLDGRGLCTGDTLFVNSVGRPDLKASDPAESRTRAHALYASLQRLFELPAETLVLSCHTSSPIGFDGRPIVATLSQVRGAVPLLAEPESAFVEALLKRIPRTPPNHLPIVMFNEAGELPEGDPTLLEAGANRCAVA